MNTVKVEYVGNKPFATDNVARSGKCWKGKGTVHEVTPAQAKILVGYADQWRLAEGEQVDLIDAPVVVDVSVGKNGEIEQVNADTLNKPVEKMNAVELRAYAQHKYGKELSANRARKVLLDEVNLIENGPAQ